MQTTTATVNVVKDVKEYSWLKQFLLDGYAIIPPELITDVVEDFHTTIVKKASAVYSRDGEVGNNILPLIPDLQKVFDAEAVSTALQMLLGKEYAMQPYRGIHGVKKAEKWQRESSFGGVLPIKHNQIREVTAMYFPQEISGLDVGPTVVRRGTQYYIDSATDKNTEFGKDKMEDLDVALECKAGSVILTHTDVIRRRLTNNKALKLMFKFQFSRTVEPCYIDHSTVPEYDDVVTECVNSKVDPIARSIWNWMYNKAFSPVEGNINELTQMLTSNLESTRFHAAYSLALAGQHAILVDQITNSSSLDRNAITAALALTACRSIQAVNALLDSISSSSSSTVLAAVYVLSEFGPLVLQSGSDLKQLLQLSSTDAHTRVYLCEAIGTIFGNSSSEYSAAACQALKKHLQDENEQVRFTAARSIAQLGPAAAEATDILNELMKTDPNRYVVGYCVEALERIGTKEAISHLLQFLRHQRWCHITTKKLPF